MWVVVLSGDIPAKVIRLAAFLVAIATTASGEALATADGPDHYRVQGLADGRHLALRAKPLASSPQIGRMPADAHCLRSLGCQGGLTFQEFTTLSDKEKRRRAAQHPRWCKVEYQGNVGWVPGRYLEEDACPPSPMPESSR